MKQLKLIAISVLCILTASCSKKSDAVTPTRHTIKITISGSANFNLTVTTSTTAGAAEKLVANSLAVAKGTTYTYSEQLQSTGFLSFSLLSDVSNTISYTIYNDDKVVLQDTNGQAYTHTVFGASYLVP